MPLVLQREVADAEQVLLLRQYIRRRCLYALPVVEIVRSPELKEVVQQPVVGEVPQYLPDAGAQVKEQEAWPLYRV